MRILHVIPAMRQGGAEAMLASLIQGTSEHLEHRICALLPGSSFFALPPGSLLEGPGRRGSLNPALLRHVRRAVRETRPNVIHGWMYHSNLLAGLGALEGIPILWSVHNTHLRPGEAKWSTRAVNRACALVSALVPSRIAYVSQAARALHEAQGYDRRKGVVIPNGIDLDRFDSARVRPSPLVPRLEERVNLGIVARYDPGKGQHLLIDVLARHPDRDRLQIAFVGEGCDTAPELRSHLERTGLLDRSILLGPVARIEEIFAALDIVSLPSYGEALPMSILEAAAMNRVVTASRVGDIPLLGFPESLLFPAGDSRACARALSAAIAMVASRDGLAFRETVARPFDLKKTGAAYRNLYAELAGRASD